MNSTICIPSQPLIGATFFSQNEKQIFGLPSVSDMLMFLNYSKRSVLIAFCFTASGHRWARAQPPARKNEQTVLEFGPFKFVQYENDWTGRSNAPPPPPPPQQQQQLPIPATSQAETATAAAAAASKKSPPTL